MKQDNDPFNLKIQPHGLWIHYYNKGNVRYKGQYVNGTKHGYWIENLIFHNYLVTFFIK